MKLESLPKDLEEFLKFLTSENLVEMLQNATGMTLVSEMGKSEVPVMRIERFRCGDYSLITNPLNFTEYHLDFVLFFWPDEAVPESVGGYLAFADQEKGNKVALKVRVAGNKAALLVSNAGDGNYTAYVNDRFRQLYGENAEFYRVVMSLKYVGEETSDEE